jgi:[ribosomal protein S18]-alanine N-acetyltransferase
MNRSALIWRPMQVEEIASIAGLEARIHPFPWTDVNLRDSLAAGHCCLVGEIGGAIVAYGILLLIAGEAQILNVSVVPEQRRQGIATALMRRFIEQSEAGGAPQVFLEVRESNKAALALYRAMGFYQVARRRGYYPAAEGREDALVMRLPLCKSVRAASTA